MGSKRAAAHVRATQLTMRSLTGKTAVLREAPAHRPAEIETDILIFGWVARKKPPGAAAGLAA